MKIGDHRRRGRGGGAEDQPELALPGDLVDERAEAGAEQERRGLPGGSAISGDAPCLRRRPLHRACRINRPGRSRPRAADGWPQRTHAPARGLALDAGSRARWPSSPP